MKNYVLGIDVLTASGIADRAVAADGDGATSESNTTLEVRQADTLSVDFVLTGTLVRQNPSDNKALFVTENEQVEKIFGVGDEIADGVVLEEIERNRVLATKNGRSYWVRINQSTSSQLAETGSTTSVAPLDRVDREEFYTPEGVLMEGAAARVYGVDLDSEPVQEVVDMDQRLENLPDDVKMRNGVPETWWNPQNSRYTPDKKEMGATDPNAADSQDDVGEVRRPERTSRGDRLKNRQKVGESSL